ncbi:hypothetical protein LPJGGPFB_04303 [Ensifer adhaerens]|nr:hypothetical protein [Ensifer adhaerens]
MEKGVQVSGDRSAGSALKPHLERLILGVIQTGVICGRSTDPILTIGIVGAYLKNVCLK